MLKVPNDIKHERYRLYFKIINMKDAGFTLVELLVVVGIIGILATLSVLNFAEYRKSATFATMKVDAHNMLTAQSAHMVEGAHHLICDDTSGSSQPSCETLPGFSYSENNCGLTGSSSGGAFGTLYIAAIYNSKYPTLEANKAAGAPDEHVAGYYSSSGNTCD